MHESIFATNRSRNANYYLKGNPVALVAQNLPSYMGGRANPWNSNPNSIMLQTKLGNDVAPGTFNFKESNQKDGLLEISATDTFFHMILDSS